MLDRSKSAHVAAAFAVACLLFAPHAYAKGHPRAGGGGHHAAHPPKMHAAPRSAPKPHNTPARTQKPAHVNAPKTPQPRNTARTNTTRGTMAATRATTSGNTTAATTGGLSTGTRSSYYGTQRHYGRGRMPYRHYASSYGRRNYGTNRYSGAIVSRLRSAYSTLARADHDYKGHRVQAMRSVRSAIRTLSYSSSRGYGTSMTGFQGTGRRNNLNGNGNNNVNGNRGRRQGQRLSQAQSDSLMRRAGQTLQLVTNHMANQGGNSRTNRAYGHVNRALQHISVALNVR